MIQTNYVALERPYRVIYYNGVMGLQIGSLIVTKEKPNRKGGSAVEIKSHPVVSYCGAEIKKKDTIFSPSPGRYSEGVVWDQVEQNDVSTLCIEGGYIHAEVFKCDIAEEIWKRGLKNGMWEAIRTASQIRRYMNMIGCQTTGPMTEDGIWRCESTLGIYEKRGIQMCGNVEDDEFYFETPIDKNEDEIVKALLEQQEFWQIIMGASPTEFGFMKDLIIDFKPSDNNPLLVRITEKLNKVQGEFSRITYLYENKE